ncbi:TetR/AcrR family transcriptional regulator [Actinomadura hibisca]|uniref:TetR/AcrR family transcriptional regulator n=1 Tax=Actinomadura hibisca TaxID=68565 RepID=UPI00082E4A72|nr:TetR/AcrR family transcriptional regulator [Actinomadura hibisca]
MRRRQSTRLTRERIVATALRIVTREGSGALSMRRVADALGSAPMSLYRHVRDKDELLLLVLDASVADLPRPDLPADPRARLLALLTWQHAELAARPWIVEVLVKGDLMAPSIAWLLEEIYATWRACGLTLAQAATANRIVWNMLAGDLVQRAERTRAHARSRTQDAKTDKDTAKHARPAGRDPYQVSVPARADPAAHPNLAALAGYWTAADRRDHLPGDLAALVDALLAAPPVAPPAAPPGTGAGAAPAG